MMYHFGCRVRQSTHAEKSFTEHDEGMTKDLRCHGPDISMVKAMGPNLASYYVKHSVPAGPPWSLSHLEASRQDISMTKPMGTNLVSYYVKHSAPTLSLHGNFVTWRCHGKT